MRQLNLQVLRPAARLLVVPLLLALAGCSAGDVLNPAGDVAVQERDLIYIATVLMLVIIIPVMVLTVLFARRYRRGAGAKYDPHFDHSTWLELVIWACPLLIIIALGAVTWSSTHLLDPFRPLDRIAPGQPVTAGTKPLDVQVVALDWKWLFIYPEQGIATINELALPVGVPVRFSLTTTDQMNTFYAPTLAGMIYTMPGMQSMLNAVLNRPVETTGYSGNFTGDGYSYMRFALHGLAPADFDKWVADVKSSSTALDAAKFLDLAKPSERDPVAHFGTVTAGLFARVVNQCVAPGTTCAADIARHDEAQGSGAMSMPMGPEGTAPGVTPQVPPAEKTPAEIGGGDQTINQGGAQTSNESGLKPASSSGSSSSSSSQTM